MSNQQNQTIRLGDMVSRISDGLMGVVLGQDSSRFLIQAPHDNMGHCEWWALPKNEISKEPSTFHKDADGDMDGVSRLRNLYYGGSSATSDSGYLCQIRDGIRELTDVVRELVAEVRKLQNGI